MPHIVVVSGNFAEFALGTPLLGIDLPGNRVLYSGNSANRPLCLVTRAYAAAAYVSLFATTDPSTLAGRYIGLNELAPTGSELLVAISRKHGVPATSAKDDDFIEGTYRSGSILGLPALVRKKWGEGTHTVGSDVWDVPGYEKKRPRCRRRT